MKGAPNWKSNKDSVDGMWKIQLLIWLGQTFHIRHLIETGTCHGTTPAVSWTFFDTVNTIELHDGLFAAARERLKDIKSIRVHHGSSPIVLPGVIESVPREPILFWLDAHASGPQTADDGDPLGKELAIVMRMCPDALIVIDDMADEHLRHLTERGLDLTGWHREYRTGEIIMYQEGRYRVPPFEAD